MSMIEMQPAVLSPSFPVSDARPSLSSPYLDHAQHASSYVGSRQSSKENKTPPVPDTHFDEDVGSPRAARGLDATVNGSSPQKVQLSPQSSIAGKKRAANGQVKEYAASQPKGTNQSKFGHSRTTSAVSNASSASMVELSQQLRTRLTYAMIKVQNGWQNRSLDEVESLASASPRSTNLHHGFDNIQLMSPRVVMSAHQNRQMSESSTDSGNSPTQQTHELANTMSPPPARKGLAPPANIVSRSTQQRRRPTPNMQVRTGLGLNQPSSDRPTIKQRTPSQNAAMEADAVETLLFMASPNNSGHHSSQFSPVTSAPSVHHFPLPTSPLRNTFSAPASPRKVAFVHSAHHSRRYGGDKSAVIESVMEKIDDEGDEELDKALALMDRHHAAKIAT